MNIDIIACTNGYRVNTSVKKRNETNNWDYEYVENNYVFTSWDEVVNFISNNKLEFAAING